MRTKASERTQAMRLRSKGLSYSEIQKIVPVSQASLSLWLRNISLTKKQRIRLSSLSLKGQKIAARSRHEQRLARLAELKAEVKRELPPLIGDPFFMLGLALYWAEGAKQKEWNIGQRVKVINSDPLLLQLMQLWLKQYCGVNDDKFTYRLHVHDSADLQVARTQWARLLGQPIDDIKWSFKHHKIIACHKHNNYIGLMSIEIRKSTWLNRRIELWAKEVAQKFLEKR